MKTTDILDEIYNLFAEKMQFSTDDAELIKAKHKIESLLENSDYESSVLDYGIAYEKAGFRYGFVLAVQIMSQCIVAMPSDVA